MKNLNRILTLLTAALLDLNTLAADSQDRPLHVLYLGTVNAGGRGGGFGSRTNYVYLPGQTLAPEAIYFDHRSDFTNITERLLQHYDAVVQAAPDADIATPQQKILDGFKTSGKGLIKYTDGVRPVDSVLRDAVLSIVSKKSKSAWEAFVASRAPLKRQGGEIPNYERRPEPVQFQLPLEPKDSIKYTQVPADFDLQLFAAEPDVVKPIFVAWDERGRAWVVEARDYPHGLVARRAGPRFH